MKKQQTQAALRVEQVIRRLKSMLPGKVRAYGAAHELQPRLLGIMLEQYREPGSAQYNVPSHIWQQIPRVTRCLDRIIRIMSAPAEGDLLGESPWLDLAGDAIAGQATVDAMYDPDQIMSTGSGPRLSDLAGEAVIERPFWPICSHVTPVGAKGGARCRELAAHQDAAGSVFCTGHWHNGDDVPPTTA